MSKNKYTDEGLAELRAALAPHGVPFPENIVGIISGTLSTCLIGEKKVLKLFKKLPKNPSSRVTESQLAAIEHRYFDSAIQGYTQVTEAADALTRRGVEVPRLIDFGSLLVGDAPSPLQLANGERFHAWQMMTRVDGKTLGGGYDFGHMPKSPLWYTGITRTMAKVAAKIHITVDATGRKIDMGPKIVGSRPIGVDRRTSVLLAALEKDIKKLTTPTQTTTLLHGDYHQENVLKTKAGKYSVIDWDQQRFGRPEQDVYHMFQRQPDKIREFCSLYNATATHPLNEKLVVAYGLKNSVLGYTCQLKYDNKTRYSKLKRSQFMAEMEWRIIRLAEIMHRLTGKKVYADAAKNFSCSQSPLGRPAASRLKPTPPELTP